MAKQMKPKNAENREQNQTPKRKRRISRKYRKTEKGPAKKKGAEKEIQKLRKPNIITEEHIRKK